MLQDITKSGKGCGAQGKRKPMLNFIEGGGYMRGSGHSVKLFVVYEINSGLAGCCTGNQDWIHLKVCARHLHLMK